MNYLELCLAVARESNDPSTKVGAVIIKDNEIKATGCNSLGIFETPERLNDRDLKIKLVVHAEMNAILAAAKRGVSTNGCTLYMLAVDVKTSTIWGGPPCTRCVVELIQAGISQVKVPIPKNIPERWQVDLKLSKSLLLEAGVIYNEIYTR